MLINTDSCQENLISPTTRVLYFGDNIVVPDRRELTCISCMRVPENNPRARFPSVYETPVFMETTEGTLKFGMLSVLFRNGAPDYSDPKFAYLPNVHTFLASMPMEDCARYVAGIDAGEVCYSDKINLRQLCQVIQRVAALKLDGTLARYRLYEA